MNTILSPIPPQSLSFANRLPRTFFFVFQKGGVTVCSMLIQ